MNSTAAGLGSFCQNLSVMLGFGDAPMPCATAQSSNKRPFAASAYQGGGRSSETFNFYAS
jgi:hypothetical protein